MHCLLSLITLLFHLIYEKANKEEELKTKLALQKLRTKPCTSLKGLLWGTLKSEEFSKLLSGG